MSVILPVYNQEKYLHETIESILAQTFKEFELIILDDGSSDKSAEIIRDFKNRDDRVKAYYKKNTGKSNSTNYLVSQAKGQWCAFIDADDVMLPGRLEKQVEWHKKFVGVDAFSCNCSYTNGEGSLFGTQRYTGLSTPAAFRLTIKKNKFITCSYTGLMVSRKAFIDVGGLDPVYEPCEDFEFVNRFVDKGLVLLVIPEVLMKYRIHPSAITIKKPLLVLDTIAFVKHNISLRRVSQPNISYQAFCTIRSKYPRLKKLNKQRFNYSMILFRNAGLAILSKQYGSFFLKILASVMLSPNYVFKKFRNHLSR